MVATFFKYLVIGICAIFALKIAVAVLGMALGLLAVALPVALIGWVAYKILGGKSESRQISDADRKWLNS